MKKTGKDIFLTLLARRYNVIVSESAERSQENVLKSIHDLCPELTAFHDVLRIERAWTTIIFHGEELLAEKPRLFQRQSIFKWDNPTTVILIYNRSLTNYSLTFKAGGKEDAEMVEQFIRKNSDLFNHVIILDSPPYRNGTLVNTFLPLLKALPQSLSICILVGIKRFGATDETPLISEIGKIEERYKNEYGDGFVSLVNKAFNTSGFLRVLRPAMGYHSYMYSIYYKALDNAHNALKAWDYVWESLFRDEGEIQVERVRKDVSNVLEVFDQYRLLTICPGWKDIVENSILSGETKSLGQELKQYFDNEINLKKDYIK